MGAVQSPKHPTVLHHDSLLAVETVRAVANVGHSGVED
jgi:hypothetical protein